MDAYDEMLVNLRSLKRCRKTANIISIVYMVTCILYASLSLIWALIGDCDSFLFMLIDGIAVKGFLLYCGYKSCYKHSSIHALASLLIQGLSVLVAQTVSLGLFNRVDEIVLVIAIAGTFLLFIINPRFKYLIEQPGYPYFNQMMEEDKFDKRQQRIKSEFEQRYEERIRQSRSDMDELEDPVYDDDEYTENEMIAEGYAQE